MGTRTLSSPQENRYGCRGETASPRTVEMWPVRESLSAPDARSQILMTRSPAPVANHWLPGSTATLRTQPRWPEMTRTSFHWGWYVGLTVRVVLWRVSASESLADVANVDGCALGALSMVAIMRAVSGEAVGGESGAGRRVRERRTAGEEFLGGAGGPDGGLLCEEGGGELTVVGVLVGHFDGEVEAGAVGGGGG